MIALSFSTLIMLLYLMRNEDIYTILSPLLKSMIVPIMYLISLSPFIALILNFFTAIPLVITFAIIVSSARLVWDAKVFTLKELSVEL